MGLVWWWMLIVWAVLIGAGVWWWLRRSKTKGRLRGAGVPIAHRSRITALPSYQRLEKRYRIVLRVLVILVGIACLSAIMLSARPISQSLVSPEQKNRDIMLCLDVSGSMIEADKGILEQYKELAENFDGQRIGLTTFNSSAAMVFPLTDDYTLIKEALGRGINAFEALESGGSIDSFSDETYADYTYIMDGTNANMAAGSSLAGDGLAQCIQRMGGNEQGRSQSVILATDNDVVGKQVVTVVEAASLAKQQGVRVYVLDPVVSNGYDAINEEKDELKEAAAVSGGSYASTQEASIPTIIADISSQEATLFSAPPELVQADIPLPFVISIVIVVIGLLLFAWRLGL